MSGSIYSLTKALAGPLVRRAARAHIAGADLESAAAVCGCLEAQGFRTTLCFWEDPSDPVELIETRYRQALERFEEEDPGGYLSVKAPALRFSESAFRKLAKAGARRNIRIHFDAQSPETADRTFELIGSLGDYRNLGCTLPGRWARSLKDANFVIERQLFTRVVKGQWADPSAPDRDSAKGFLEVIRALAGRARHVGVATHNPRLARQALRILREQRTPCELEVLYGLPERPMLAAAQELGVPVRFYIPYGRAWLPYALNRAIRDPKTLWWFLRAQFVGQRSVTARLSHARARIS